MSFISISQRTASMLYGFKKAPKSYPCSFCGVLTNLLDPEDFYVCAEHQREHAEVGFAEMERRYPLFGKDERNPEFFKTLALKHLARGKRLTRRELKLLIKWGGYYDRERAQILLDGGVLDDRDLESLGYSAEEYIDSVPWWWKFLSCAS